MCKEKETTVINFRVTKEKLVNFLNFVRAIPKSKFDAAELADAIIREYFKELEEWK